jgi:hypothetical protein
MPRGYVQFAQIQVGLSVLQQQHERASRPRLSEADDTVLKLVLRALGERHYLNASLVCRAWREAYGASVQQSKLTCCKPYLQDAAMWLHIKELGLHESIPTALFRQYGGDSALNDKLAAAVDKLKPRETLKVTVVEQSSLRCSKEFRRVQLFDKTGRFVFESSDDVKTLLKFRSMDIEHMGTLDTSAQLHFVALRKAQLDEADEAERTAKLEAERAAIALAELIAKLEVVCLADTILPIVAGAAKGGRYAVCASTLAKLPAKKTITAYDKLLTSIIRALADCAAKCKDVTSFSLVLRAVLIVSYAGAPVDVEAAASSDSVSSGCESAHKWNAAAVCNEHCDTTIPLQQFAKLMYIKYMCGDKTTVITEQLDAGATAAAVKLVRTMWSFRAHRVKLALTRALARYGNPLLHVHFIKEFEQQQQPEVVQELVHKIAQRGNVHILEHLLQEGFLSSDTHISSINNGAIEGDQIVSVEWLQSHGLLINDIRQRLVPCHQKLIAYLAEIDNAAPM